MFTKPKGFLIQKDETKTNFTKVPNEIFTLPLDVYSKMILIYLYSKSPNYVHYESMISSNTGIHRNTVSNRMTKLVEGGYLVKIEGKNAYTLMSTVGHPMHTPSTLNAHRKCTTKIDYLQRLIY